MRQVARFDSLVKPIGPSPFVGVEHHQAGGSIPEKPVAVWVAQVGKFLQELDFGLLAREVPSTVGSSLGQNGTPNDCGNLSVALSLSLVNPCDRAKFVVAGCQGRSDVSSMPLSLVQEFARGCSSGSGFLAV